MKRRNHKAVPGEPVNIYEKISKDPMYKDILYEKMHKREKKLQRLASLYFGEHVSIMYVKGKPKVELHQSNIKRKDEKNG